MPGGPPQARRPEGTQARRPSWRNGANPQSAGFSRPSRSDELFMPESCWLRGCHPASSAFRVGAEPGRGPRMRVLVTGITGYIGAALAPQLQAAGHHVRGYARSAERVERTGLRPDSLVVGDAVAGTGLDAALDGVECAYYLIHSMEGAAASFEDQELRAARQFGQAAAAA